MTRLQWVKLALTCWVFYPRQTWWMWRQTRNQYTYKIGERRYKLFPVSHIVLTDADLEVRR